LTLPVNTPNVVRLTQSLVIDAGRLRTDIGWRPPYGLDAGLRETATWYWQARRRVDADGSAVPAPRRLREPMFKRPFDLCLSGVGLFLSVPLWLVIAASIWFEDGRPIFFRQPRIGRHGRLFRVLKFRSMVQNPVHTEVQARKDDPRITRIGRMLRRTSLDELPQVWNIFLGQMSFVGPRAQPERELVKVDGVKCEVHIRQVPGYELRQLVRPGLTGIAQLYAPRGVSHEHKFRYDLVYVRRLLKDEACLEGSATARAMFQDLRLLLFDLGLILRSVWITLTARWEV
jgi:lipopolysaccharide/colanic/teichoic acid biosynthesis glycosyltransferase